jgi:hypothetical protein
VYKQEPGSNFKLGKRTSNLDVRTSYLSLFNEIVDSIPQQMRERFKNVEDLDFSNCLIVRNEMNMNKIFLKLLSSL